MPKIRILPAHEAQKIAAGEIVERPASVVKELLENAVDAGATQITVYVEDGGKKVIRVTDNGFGMDYEDAHACTALHATSKISSIDDLPSVRTFGFRGEALAALAAASKMTITTKQADVHEAIYISMEHGSHISTEPKAAPTGTCIELRDLFCTIPARQKFLKKRETELNHIRQLFDALMIVHPQVHAKLYSDGTLLYQYLPAATQKERIEAITQSMMQDKKLLLCQAQKDDLRMTAYISDHQHMRYDRAGIMIFANNRWIHNAHLSRVITKAYARVLPMGKFPVVVLLLELPGAALDINVHPRKEEVQFAHPRIVEQLVHDAIHEQLNAHISNLLYVPSAQQFQYDMQAPIAAPYITKQLSTSPMQILPVYTQQKYASRATFVPVDVQIPTPAQVQNAIVQPMHQDRYEIIGQLHKTYILVQHTDGLLIVDQHAAHECVLFNIFSREDAQNAPIQLLFPALVSLTAAEIEIVEPYFAVLHENGIMTELFGQTQVRIVALPVSNKQDAAEDLIRTLLVTIYEHRSLESSALLVILHKKLRAQMACKAAVKAGDVLDDQQMHALLKNLYATKEHLTCPHGRPTCWLISQYEIEKRFKRII